MNSQNICNFEERGFLKRLGVYGFEPVEKVILAALITMDPLPCCSSVAVEPAKPSF